MALEAPDGEICGVRYIWVARHFAHSVILIELVRACIARLHLMQPHLLLFTCLVAIFLGP